MKKKWIMSLIAGVFTLTAAMPVLAAPKQMSDGNMFDAEYYAASNPDVAAVFGTNETMLYSHYLNCGKLEGRKSFAEEAVTPKFDAVYYAKNNPDVVAVLGTGETMLYNHYINCGKAEGRIPCEGGVPFMEVAPLETQAQPEVPVQPTLTNVYNIVLKNGYSYVDMPISSYEDACAIASALGYDLWEMHDDGNGGMWCYILYGGIAPDGLADHALHTLLHHSGRYRPVNLINTKDGRLYLEGKDGFKSGWIQAVSS